MIHGVLLGWTGKATNGSDALVILAESGAFGSANELEKNTMSSNACSVVRNCHWSAVVFSYTNTVQDIVRDTQIEINPR